MKGLVKGYKIVDVNSIATGSMSSAAGNDFQVGAMLLHGLPLLFFFKLFQV